MGVVLKMIKLNKKYKHKENQKIYIPIKWCKFKDPDTREWLECVMYVPEDNPDIDEPYVRTLDDFADRFEDAEES